MEYIKKESDNSSSIFDDNLKIHENSDKPGQYGCSAFIEGNNIYIDKRAKDKKKLILHEKAHYIQQRYIKVPPEFYIKGKPFNTDKKLENEADNIAKGLERKDTNTISKFINPAAYKRKPIGSINNKTIQCWGVGGFLSKIMALFSHGTIGEPIGEHETFTSTAALMANKKLNTEFFSKDDVLKLSLGSNFNDNMSQSNFKFVTDYVLKTNEFINQNQRGSLLAIHCMGPFKEMLKNKEKMNIWAQLCLDTYFNSDINGTEMGQIKFQELSLAQYLKINAEDKSLLEMFLPVIIKDGTYKTAYADMSIAQFFGLNRISGVTSSKDVSLIALGSLLHIIQDSTASGHSKRMFDPRTTKTIQDCVDFTDTEQVLHAITPISAILDPQYQNMHSKGDYLPYSPLGFRFDQQQRLNLSDGGYKAQLLSAALLHYVAIGRSKEDIFNFFDKITALDSNTILIEQLKLISDQHEREALLAGTDLEGLTTSISFTAGGRGYSSIPLNEHEKNNRLIIFPVYEYTTLVRNCETGNAIKPTNAKIKELSEQLRLLNIILEHSSNQKTKLEVKKHLAEILLDLISIIKLEKESSFVSITQNLKSECINLINGIGD